MLEPKSFEEPSPVFALSFHADYRCRHSGACCTADWDVPVEVPLYRGLNEALAEGRVSMATPPADALIIDPDPPEGTSAIVARVERGDCVFYHRPSGLCAVHRDLGDALLPATCRHFPRVAVHDRRGTFISLTHYCPTAAGMLFREDVPIAIVQSPPAFPPADYEGLTVEPDAWPPLLQPDMLMDDEAYACWERHMVARCADANASPEDVLATLERDARHLRRYRPSDGPLIAAVSALPATLVRRDPEIDLESSLALYREVRQAIPEELLPPADENRLGEVFASAVAPEWWSWSWPLKRFLAAKAFAAWTAYQGRGLLTVVRGLEAALALVRVEAARQCRDRGQLLDRESLLEAIRQTDFILNHLAVGEELASLWSRVEES